MPHESGGSSWVLSARSSPRRACAPHRAWPSHTVRFVVFFFWLAQEVEQEVDVEAGDLGLPFVQDEGQDEWEQYMNWGSDDVERE